MKKKLSPKEEALLLEKFKVEELEKRYEMAWINKVVVGIEDAEKPILEATW